MKLCILLRGHIRSSFDNDELINRIRFLNNHYEICIYIQTWTKFEASKSWRNLNTCDKEVNEDIIYNYFKELKDKVKKIIILDDNLIKIQGNTDGVISSTQMPTKNWKFMWYGIYKLTEYVYNSGHTFKKVLNLRFDIYNHKLSEKYLNFDDNILLEKINNYKYSNLIDFFIISCPICVDNIYVSNIKFLYKIHYNFCYNLDEILKKYPTIIFQESIFYFEILRINQYYKFVIFGINDYSIVFAKYIQKKNQNVLIVDSDKKSDLIFLNNLNIIKTDSNEFISNNNFEKVIVISEVNDNIVLNHCQNHIEYNINEKYNFNDINNYAIQLLEYI